MQSRRPPQPNRSIGGGLGQLKSKDTAVLDLVPILGIHPEVELRTFCVLHKGGLLHNMMGITHAMYVSLTIRSGSYALVVLPDRTLQCIQR